jgi:hypothetical protein
MRAVHLCGARSSTKHELCDGMDRLEQMGIVLTGLNVSIPGEESVQTASMSCHYSPQITRKFLLGIRYTCLRKILWWVTTSHPEGICSTTSEQTTDNRLSCVYVHSASLITCDSIWNIIITPTVRNKGALTTHYSLTAWCFQSVCSSVSLWHVISSRPLVHLVVTPPLGFSRGLWTVKFHVAKAVNQLLFMEEFMLCMEMHISKTTVGEQHWKFHAGQQVMSDEALPGLHCHSTWECCKSIWHCLYRKISESSCTGSRLQYERWYCAQNHATPEISQGMCQMGPTNVHTS